MLIDTLLAERTDLERTIIYHDPLSDEYIHIKELLVMLDEKVSFLNSSAVDVLKNKLQGIHDYVCM
jgi:hypothetical protein